MPDRLALVKGPPAGRRAHLDGFCAALWPARTETRRRYARALAQRNALLGRIRAGTAGLDGLDAWDAELATSAIGLIADRREATELLAPEFAPRGARPRLRRRCHARLPAAQRCGGRRRRSRPSSANAGRPISPAASPLGVPTSMSFRSRRGGRSLRRYGSQGQQRAALLALLFAEREVLIDDGRPAPLMLLDDVASELDAEHRDLLVERLAAGGGQALVTATEPQHLPRAGDRHELAMRERPSPDCGPGGRRRTGDGAPAAA